MSKIFISYSHKDKKWKDFLVKHLKVLQMKGELEVWDDQKIKPGVDWNKEIQKALSSADAAILLISADFLTSGFILNEEIPVLLQQRAKQRMKIFPLIVRDCPWKGFDWLSSIQVWPKDGKTLSQSRHPKIDSILSDFAVEIRDTLKQTTKTETTIADVHIEKGPGKVSLYKLPTTGKELFGRKEELAFLNNAWADEHTHIATLVAWGGVGKTALVNHWLNLMERKNYCGAKKVFGWSFYSQVAEEGKQASADEFMQKALEWFADSPPGEGSAVEKGRRLARLIQQEKTLLILDGMEPLQYPPNEVHGFDGRLKEQGMRAFLRELAGSNPGLCVITTRERLTDLADRMNFTVKEIELQHLSVEVGSQLLKSLGAVGSEKELVKAVKAYDGHALALTLLGQYIKSVYKGDIRKRYRIPKLIWERRLGRHARRVMAAYEKWLKKSPERDLLYIMGLFDCPVAVGAVEALKADPPIPGITEQLQKLDEDDWQWTLSILRTANLLAKENPKKPDTLDCHPLVREYFGQKFQSQNPKGWKAAHQRLYHYYKNLPEKHLPDTLQEMEPLFAAVVHGCRAGLHQEALDEVYWKRISRGKVHYIKHNLGAFGADLAALSHFFEVPWSRPAPGLTDEDKSLILSWAAFGLRAVGRLQEGIQPMKEGLEMRVNQKAWKNAAVAASNLSELMLTLGDVSQAVDYARQSVTHADRSSDDFQKGTRRTTLADALHQSGQVQEAKRWFREAEIIQNKREPGYPFLYSLRGFQFCDLLLGQGKYREVIKRAEQTLKLAEQEKWILDISLYKLSLGQAWIMQTLEEKTGDFSKAGNYLDEAVEGLRESGDQDMLPLALLKRAECYRRQNKFSLARDDLKEALEIAEIGSMKLYLVDYHLEARRLCEAEGKTAEAKLHFDKAAKMIEETGYHRRDNEVKQLKSQ